MEVPLELSFDGIEKTTPVEQLIHEQVAKLEKYFDHIISCRVTVERPQAAGNPYGIRIIVRVPPEHELVVRQEAAEGAVHEDLDTLIRDAFKRMQRQIKKHAAQLRGEVKSHPDQVASALVVRIFHDQDYGFLKTINDEEVYFHRNSVLNDDFDRLEIGTGVRFQPEQGDEGLQASTVQIVDKPGARVKAAGDKDIGVPRGWRE